MVSLGSLRKAERLFPQIGAEIVDQIGQMFPVDGPDRLALEVTQESQLQAEIRLLPLPDFIGIGETLRRSKHFPRHP